MLAMDDLEKIQAHFSIDPRRSLVEAERLARPPVPVETPALVQHLIFKSDGASMESDSAGCRSICKALGLGLTVDLPDQIRAEGRGLVLKWERHTEYASYTFIANSCHGEEADALETVPSPLLWSERDLGWNHVPGKLLGALVIGIERQEVPFWSDGGFFGFDEERPLGGSAVMDGQVSLETDFRVDDRGFNRILVKERAAVPARLGRLVQRLIEIETYGALCLYAWEDVKTIGPLMGEADGDLQEITRRLARPGDEPDEVILHDLAALSARCEDLSARAHFRLNASLAYYDIVCHRLAELREERLVGRQRIGSFVSRRMDPAARTYRAVLRRQSEMADRISRSAELLRGRIEVALGKQNQELLKTLNARAEAQYRLQKTVEGLSTVAISYYALGILGYMAAAASGFFPGLSVKQVVGLAAPIVVLLVWMFIRRLRK